MKKFYPAFITLTILSSCATRVDYIGNAYTPSKQVDVFVEKDAIKKPYDVIGKGYVRMGTAFSSLEKVQKRAVEKAKQKGAHAVIVQDYFVLNTDSHISTSFSTDSSKNVVGAGSVQTNPAISSGLQVLFIRYRP